uniref:Uncharacterized protein n=1 Tax=Rhizophora mucronata TaxID=61149 RepID=A0A2P2NCV4_RHIMU
MTHLLQVCFCFELQDSLPFWHLESSLCSFMPLFSRMSSC